MARNSESQTARDDKAQRLLDSGATVREVALALGVTTQAIYKRIAAGKIRRPEAA